MLAVRSDFLREGDELGDFLDLFLVGLASEDEAHSGCHKAGSVSEWDVVCGIHESGGTVGKGGGGGYGGLDLWAFFSWDIKNDFTLDSFGFDYCGV